MQAAAVVPFVPKKRAPKVKAPVPLEKHIQAAIKAHLELLGYMVEVLRQGAMKIPRPGRKPRFVRLGLKPGAPDLQVITARALFLEVKRPGEKLDPHQADWHRDARNQGAFVAVVRSVEDARGAMEDAKDIRNKGERWAA